MDSLVELYKIGHGPSSSHTMGPAKACQYLKEHFPETTRFEITLYGSLALTGKGHLTDIIILNELGPNTKIVFDIKSKVKHPNTFITKVFNDEKLIKQITFISLGGGSISIDGKVEESNKDIYPFHNFEEIKRYACENNISLDKVVDRFENIDEYLKKVYFQMDKTITDGLTKDGVLPGKLQVKRKAKIIYSSLHEDDGHEKVIRLLSAYAYACSEENASGAIVVTSPTCGSSGVLASAFYYYYHDKNTPIEKIIEALKVGGLIGNVIKHNASIAGAYAGCQSEIGSACSMAAAAICFLEGGNIKQIEYASEIAMEHHLGLTCDPVEGMVQIPCIERNAVATLRAFDAAYLATILSSLSQVSFDTVVETMYQTGKDLKNAYKETSKGGLAKYFFHK